MRQPVAYLRKSQATPKQPAAHPSNGQPAWQVQETLIRELAARHGDEDLLVLSDTHGSGQGDRTDGPGEFTRLKETVKNGEVSVPLSYVTGTIVKMGQGIERHIAGGKAADWLGYFMLLASFMAGAGIGGFIGAVVNGTWMLAIATAVCALTTLYTYFHQDRRALLAERSAK